MRDEKILVSNSNTSSAPAPSTPAPKVAVGASPGKRGMDDALKYVGKNWFPINRDVLAHVQNKLRTGEYTSNMQELVNDIKGDLSLYTLCLSKLKDFVGKNQYGRLPTEILANSELDHFRSVLDVPEEQLSQHKFDPEMKAQVMCLKHAIVSSSTAESLASKNRIDPEMAFMCASVRQLGLNLVSWNYPRIYTKALSSVTASGESLDRSLFKVLGYSPLQLGLKAALDWNESDEVRIATGFEEFDRPYEKRETRLGKTRAEEVSETVPQKIKRFCEIGEAVARINDPEHFPHASKDWEVVSTEIKHYLGPQGIALIGQKILSASQSYQALAPGLFAGEFAPEVSIKTANKIFVSKLYEENVAIKRCNTESQPLFRRTYDAMRADTASPASINVLVTQVMPVLGFTNGCIYLVDIQKMQAVPMMRIGEHPLSRYKALSCTDTGKTHPVIEALNYSAPIIQEGVIINGEQVAHITGVFGSRERPGVLYLEMSDSLIGQNDRNVPLQYFKAVKQCLNDCLGIKN